MAGGDSAALNRCSRASVAALNGPSGLVPPRLFNSGRGVLYRISLLDPDVLDAADATEGRTRRPNASLARAHGMPLISLFDSRLANPGQPEWDRFDVTAFESAAFEKAEKSEDVDGQATVEYVRDRRSPTRREPQLTRLASIIIVPAIGARPSTVKRHLFDTRTSSADHLYGSIKGARVWIFEYPAGSPSTYRTILHYYAEVLLQLVNERKPRRDGQHRLLHFVGHSSGGLVVKKALANAQRSGSLEFSSIVHDCSGVSFFGVPHQGSSIIADAPFALSLREELSLFEEMPPNLRRLLAPDSEELLRIASDFAPVSRRLQRIWTFIEDDDTTLTALASDDPNNDAAGRKIELRFPVVDSRSARLYAGNETVFVMSCKHSELLGFYPRKVTYLNQLSELFNTTIKRKASDLEPFIKTTLEVDLHLFYDSAQNNQKPAIKVWSVYPSLEKLLQVGPVECFKSRLRTPSLNGHIQNGSLTTKPNANGLSPQFPHMGRRMSAPSIQLAKEENEEQDRTTDVPQIVISAPSGPAEDFQREDSQDSNEAEGKKGTEIERPTNLKPGSFGYQAKDSEAARLFLMRESLTYQLPDEARRKFRWLHIPYNNMVFVPEIMPIMAADNMRIQETLLHENNFDRKQSIARHGRPHSRSMTPSCKYFPAETKAANNSESSESEQLCIYLPYLHWDRFITSEYRNRLLSNRFKDGEEFSAAQDKVKKGESMEDKVMWQYLMDASNLNLHPRRTLDQYGYPNLRNTHIRDHDQILWKQRSSRNCEAEHMGHEQRQNHRWKERSTFDTIGKPDFEDDDGKVLMVDQFWCWITDPHTVMTFFPGRELEHYDQTTSKIADLRSSIYNDVNGDPRFATQCMGVFDFAALAVYHAITVFPSGNHSEPDLNFFRVFEEYISILAEKHTRSFKEFRDRYQSKGLYHEMRQHGASAGYALSKVQEQDLQSNETDLTNLLELRDVEDELGTVTKLLQQQATVVDDLVEQCYKDRPEFARGLSLLTDARQHITNYDHTVSAMLKECRAVQDSFVRLLDLKQKQANVAEAWTLREANETASGQSRAVLIFTIFTIIFSPLAFFTSLFGMNASDWSGSPTNPSLKTILVWTFPVSLVVILFALLVAFNRPIRNKFKAAIESKYTLGWAIRKKKGHSDLERGLPFVYDRHMQRGFHTIHNTATVMVAGWTPYPKRLADPKKSD